MSLNKYLIKPNSVFEIEAIKKEFLKFLKTERNEEPLMFLESVDEYKRESTSLKKLEKLQEIIKIYLDDQSTKQINIGYLEKDKFKSDYENFNKESLGDKEKVIFDEVFLKKIIKDSQKYKSRLAKRQFQKIYS
jgi:hypothetical protein